MGKEEKELLEKFRRLSSENRVNALSNIRVALAAQENTRKAMSTPAKAAPAPGKGRKSA
jgi:hypothetical protein